MTSPRSNEQEMRAYTCISLVRFFLQAFESVVTVGLAVVPVAVFSFPVPRRASEIEELKIEKSIAGETEQQLYQAGVKSAKVIARLRDVALFEKDAREAAELRVRELEKAHVNQQLFFMFLFW